MFKTPDQMKQYSPDSSGGGGGNPEKKENAEVEKIFNQYKSRYEKNLSTDGKEIADNGLKSVIKDLKYVSENPNTDPPKTEDNYYDTLHDILGIHSNDVLKKVATKLEKLL